MLSFKAVSVTLLYFVARFGLSNSLTFGTRNSSVSTYFDSPAFVYGPSTFAINSSNIVYLNDYDGVNCPDLSTYKGVSGKIVLLNQLNCWYEDLVVSCQNSNCLAIVVASSDKYYSPGRVCTLRGFSNFTFYFVSNCWIFCFFFFFFFHSIQNKKKSSLPLRFSHPPKCSTSCGNISK